MAIDPELYDGYIGQNAAHKAFKQEIVNAKVLFFQITGNRDHLKSYFESKISDARKSSSGSFSIGMVTEVFNQRQFRTLNIPHNEAELVVQSYDSLEHQFHSLLYMDLQRILESFLLDLFAEVARTDPRVLMSNRTVTFEEALKANDMVALLLDKQVVALSHSDRDTFERQFVELGLPVIPSDGEPQETLDFWRRELNLLWGVRNLLQHNHGIINEIFLKKVPDSGYSLGQHVTIETTKLGRAFSAVEAIADKLNQRAVAKYALT